MKYIMTKEFVLMYCIDEEKDKIYIISYLTLQYMDHVD